MLNDPISGKPEIGGRRRVRGSAAGAWTKSGARSSFEGRFARTLSATLVSAARLDFGTQAFGARRGAADAAEHTEVKTIHVLLGDAAGRMSLPKSSLGCADQCSVAEVRAKRRLEG